MGRRDGGVWEGRRWGIEGAGVGWGGGMEGLGVWVGGFG